MSPHYILRRSLCRPPAYFRAWVKGQGLVNDGSRVDWSEDYWRQYRERAESEIQNLDWAPEYAEPGYDTPAKGILLADWNLFPRDVGDLLERAGYALEWSDEWVMCDDCCRAIRTCPDGYDWIPQFDVGSDEYRCAECREDE